MKFKSKILNLSIDLEGNYQATILIPHEQVGEITKLKDKLIEVSLKLFRKKRSLNANAYAWQLITEIGKKIGVDKWEVYKRMLIRYSNSYQYIVIRKDTYKSFIEHSSFRVVKVLSSGLFNGTKSIQLQGYWGSSTFDTKEMSVFIDGLVKEAKDLEIETESQEEIERLVNMWE